MDRYSFTLEKRQEDSLREIQRTGDADNQSEAARKLIDTGAETLGYGIANPQTRLRGIIQRSADGFALAAIIWVGLTLVAPVGYRALSIPLFAVALGLYGFDRLIAAREPHLSKRLAAMIALGGDDA